jgi:hypothetical protein
MHAQHPSDANRVETSVVNETPNGLRVHAELTCNVADADKVWLLI